MGASAPISLDSTVTNKKPTLPLPPQALLLEYLSYDPDTGHVTRIKGRRAGKRAERMTLGGFQIKLFGIRYMAHRVIWKMVTGEDPGDQIDHRNLDNVDNTWGNLRPADYASNSQNKDWPLRDGKPKGVYPYGKGWCVMLSTKGERVIYYKGPDLAEACRVALAKAKELHGEFYRAQS